MRSAHLTAFVVLAACSSAGNRPDAAAAPQQTVRVAGTGGMAQANASMRMTAANDIAVDTIPVPLDSVWRALPQVYTALGIPTTTLDTELRQFGTSGSKVYRRLGQTALRRYLDCGSTQIGPNADSYEINIAVLTTLTKADSATTITRTTVDAVGRPMQYAGAETQCRTRGELERQIALLIRTRVLPP